MCYDREEEDAIIDEWSLVHFGAGALMKRVGIRPVFAGLLIIGYEIIEPQLIEMMRDSKLDLGWSHESERNILSDVILGFAGYFIS